MYLFYLNVLLDLLNKINQFQITRFILTFLNSFKIIYHRVNFYQIIINTYVN